MKKIKETNKTIELKRPDNQNGKVKNAGKVMGGICGVVVLAGMAVTAFAAGQKEAAAVRGQPGPMEPVQSVKPNPIVPVEQERQGQSVRSMKSMQWGLLQRMKPVQ